MKLFATFLTAILVLGAGKFVYAADEFGERFGSNAPTALREGATEEETNLQGIEPAAGEETATEGSAPDPATAEDLTVAPTKEEPAAGEATLEDDLEVKMGTEVQSTTQDLGDGQVKQHDSVGEGNVRAFYRSEQDGRVMDTDDAAGVEVKVIEFK